MTEVEKMPERCSRSTVIGESMVPCGGEITRIPSTVTITLPSGEQVAVHHGVCSRCQLQYELRVAIK